MLEAPTLRDVIDARQVIARHVHRTPLVHYSGLSELVGAEVHAKHENHQITCAFKVRGGVNLISRLEPTEWPNGVVTASTGNHAQSVAYAAGLFGITATLVMPKGSNRGKVDAVRSLGAEIVFHGQDFDDAREHAEALAAGGGYRYIHSANEPDLIAGVGTATLELFEDLPGVEVIFVPVGGGSGAAGVCIVAKALNPNVQVIGVQSEKAPAAYLSWKEGRLVTSELMETAAEGIATRVGFELTQAILREHLDDFLLVSEDAIRNAIVTYLEKAHTLAEGAASSCLAAALKVKDSLQGKRVALILSGGNLSLNQMRDAVGQRRDDTNLRKSSLTLRQSS